MDFIVDYQKNEKMDISIWVERYRPQILNDYIGNDSIKETFNAYIEKQDIPHILLFGPQGTGKTSLAKILTNNINCDYLYINASSERGIDTFRDKVKDFARGSGFKPLKIVILDESDAITAEGQAALRNMMETYSFHTRFILTCNYVEKIIPPIISRCQTFEIKPINKTDVAKKLVYILQNEKVSFTKEDIKFIIETYYPDIRKVINFAQQSNINGALKIYKDNAVDLDFHKKIVEILKYPNNPEVSLMEIRQLIVDNTDPNSLEPAYKYLMDHMDEYAKGKEAIVILRLAEGLKDSSSLINEVRDIPFLACIYNILNDLRE